MKQIVINNNTPVYFNISTDALFALSVILPSRYEGWKTQLFNHDYSSLRKSGSIHGVRLNPTTTALELYTLTALDKEINRGGTPSERKLITTAGEFFEWVDSFKPAVPAPEIAGYYGELLRSGYGFAFGCVKVSWQEFGAIKDWVAGARNVAPVETIVPLGGIIGKDKVRLNVPLSAMYSIAVYLRTLGWTDKIGESTEAIRTTVAKADGRSVYIKLYPQEGRLAFISHEPKAGVKTVTSLESFIKETDGRATKPVAVRDLELPGKMLVATPNGNGFRINSHLVTWEGFDKIAAWVESAR